MTRGCTLSSLKIYFVKLQSPGFYPGRRFFYKVLVTVLLLGLVAPPLTFGFPSFEIFPKSKEDSDPRKFRLGRVQLHPGFAFESKYDDNIFLRADSKDKDENFIFTNKPSLGVELERTPGEIFGFNFDYQGEDEHFVHLSDTQNAFNHYVTGNLNFGGAGGQSDITVSGSYDKSRNSRTFDFQTNIGNRVNIETYTGLFDFIYLPTKAVRLQLGSNFNEWRFEEPNQTFDSVLYNFNGSIFWQKSPLVAYGVLYEHSRKDYRLPSTRLDDSHTDQVLLGGGWKASAWISGELFVGLNSKRFDNFSNEDSQNLVYLIDLKYQPVERTRLTLRGSREIRDSTFSDIQFFIYNGLRLDLAQRLGRKFQAEIMGRYENFDYHRPIVIQPGVAKIRVDNRVEVSLALIYEIQDWLEAKAKYSYVENISNFDASDFTNNVGLLEISARY